MNHQKVTHWHGTTRKGFEAFKAGKGKSEAGISPWTVSDNDGMMYFHSVEKGYSFYGIDDKEELHFFLKHKCYAQAEIQSSINGESEIIILGFNLESVDIEDDYSCENMHEIADCTNTNNVNISHVVCAYSAKFNIWKSPIVISGLISNDYFNRQEVNQDLLKMAEIIDDSGYCFDPEEPDFIEINS